MLGIVLIVCALLVLKFSKSQTIVIVSSHYNEDVEWLKKVPYKVYICDKPGSAHHSIPKDPKCSLHVNRGREASSYLKWIVENYDMLPDRVVFLHGHEYAGHQKYPKHLLDAINDAKPELDFVSLNNWIHLKKPHGEPPVLPAHNNSHEFGDWQAAFDELKNNWDLFQPILKMDSVPTYYRFDASAQFIVSRRAIRKFSKDTYVKLYEYMIDECGNDFVRGVVMEFIWQTMFSDVKNDVCISLPTCSDEGYRKKYFNG